METGEQFVSASGESWNASFDPIRSADANIDPRLGSFIGTGSAMDTSLVFGANQIQSIGVFDPGAQGIHFPNTMTTNTPPSSLGTRSPSGTTSTHSENLISPMERRRPSFTSPTWTSAETVPGPRVSSPQAIRQKPLRRRYTSPSIHGSSSHPPIALGPRKPAGAKEQDDETRRNEFLRRNRLAASRCRQKKKQWVHQLEETQDELEQENTHLLMMRKRLVDEVSRMKYILMAHATCNDSNIDRWIDNEAKKVVEKSRQQYNEENRARESILCSREHDEQQDQTPRDRIQQNPDVRMNHD